MEVYTFNRLAELWLTGVGTELPILTDNIAVWGSTVLDRSLLAPLLLLLRLLLLLLLPRGGHLLLRGEDVAGTVLLTERHLEVTHRTLCLGAISEVTAGMSAMILLQSETLHTVRNIPYRESITVRK